MAEYEVTNDGIKVPRLAADPVSGRSSQIYYNTATNRFRFYNGTVWNDVGGSTASLQSSYSFTFDGRISIGLGQAGFHLGGSSSASWGLAGIAAAGVIGFTAPFTGNITRININVYEVNMALVPGVTNNVSVAMLFKTGFWNTGGSDLGTEFAVPLGADIGNFTGWQVIGPTGQGANRGVDVSIPVTQGDLLGLTLQQKPTSSTQVSSVGDISIDVEFTT